MIVAPQTDVQVVKPWDLDLWKCLLYGNAGVGKSDFLSRIIAAGLAPAKIFMFDMIGKDVPYKRLGTASPYQRMDDGGMFCFVVGPEGKPLVEIEYFFDLRPTQLASSKYPCALERFQASLQSHIEDGWAIGEEKYKLAVLDSYTGYFNCALMAQQYKFNLFSKGGNKANSMQWYGEAKLNTIADVLCSFAWSALHTCVIAHVDRTRMDQQAKQLWGVNAPGTLSGDIPASFPEVLFMYVTDEGERLLMTQTDGQYTAQSHINPPNPCLPDWEMLWSGR